MTFAFNGTQSPWHLSTVYNTTPLCRMHAPKICFVVVWVLQDGRKDKEALSINTVNITPKLFRLKVFFSPFLSTVTSVVNCLNNILGINVHLHDLWARCVTENSPYFSLWVTTSLLHHSAWIHCNSVHIMKGRAFMQLHTCCRFGQIF